MNICNDYIKRLFNPIFGFAKAATLPHTFEVRALYSKDEFRRALDFCYNCWKFDVQSGPLKGRVLRVHFVDTETPSPDFALLTTNGKIDDPPMIMLPRRKEESDRFRWLGVRAAEGAILEINLTITRSKDSWQDAPCIVTKFDYFLKVENKTPRGVVLN